MKTIYLEANIIDSSAPLIAVAINQKNEPTTIEQQRFYHAHGHLFEAVDKLFNPLPGQDVDPPDLGDVVWVKHSPNSDRTYGLCIVFDEDGNFSEDAFKYCLWSLKRKADEMRVSYIGFDRFAANDGQEWVDRVALFEECLDPVTPVVCIRSNPELLDVLDRLNNVSKIPFETAMVPCDQEPINTVNKNN